MNESALLGLQILHPLPGIPCSKDKMVLALQTHLLDQDFLQLRVKQSQRERLQKVLQLVFFLRGKRVQKEQLQFT